MKNEYLSIKTSLRVESFGEKVEEIKENEKEIERLSTSLTVLKLDKESIEKDLNESKNRFYEVNINLNKLEDLYLDKKNTQKTKTRELSEITKGKPANSLLDEIESCIEKIHEEENSTSKELDGKKKNTKEMILIEI